jgi:Histone H1-like nucleoprotein HC2/Domain of unknown function (DUF1918)
MPAAKRTSAKKTVAKKVTTKQPKSTTKRTSAKKTVAKKPAARKPVAKKTVAKKPVARKPVVRKAVAKRGDVILIDSEHVGTPPREGEVLKIVRGELSVSYWVRWADGHDSFITPKPESVQIASGERS